MKKTKFALIGCGRVAVRHAEAFQKTENGEIVAVCDKKPEAADKFAKLLGARAFYSTQDLYKAGDFDVAIVATPSGDHYERVLEALFQNKHVVCEKPIALRLSHAKEMEEEAKKRNLNLWVAFQNRYNPATLKVKSVMESGRLGTPVLGTVRLRWCREQNYYSGDDWHGTWKMDGGVLSQQAIHHLDALTWLFGEVESVSAVATTRLVKMECEDLCVATLKFKNGALGAIEATTAVRPRDIEASVSLIGSEGSIVISGVGINRIETFDFVKPEATDAEVPRLNSQEVPNGYGFGHDKLFPDVAASVQGESPVKIPVSEAMRSLRLLHAIYASVEQGRTIRLDENVESQRLGLGTLPNKENWK